MSGPEALFGRSFRDLTQICDTLGLPRYAPAQIADWLYKKNALGIEEMTNLSRSSRRRLEELYTVGTAEPADLRHSADGTLKYLFAFEEVPGDVESGERLDRCG